MKALRMSSKTQQAITSVSIGLWISSGLFGQASPGAAAYAVLYAFQNAAGENPYSGSLFWDSEGNLYGTTSWGGDLNCGAVSGCGVVFMLDATGTETVLHSFTGAPDGNQPYGGVTRDSAGNFYGTTYSGGTSNAGTVFKLDSAWNETVLYSFTGGADGCGPQAGVILDSLGNLYGTTAGCGSASNAGVVYKLTRAGKLVVLHTFTGGTDGASSEAGLIRDAEGNLYGTTSRGGGSIHCYEGCGIVFKLSSTGTETILHSFTGTPDGASPAAGVVRDAAGNLYGTTVYGGMAGCSLGCGMVYKLDTTNQLTVLYNFTGGTDGGNPVAGVIRSASGNLYGDTYVGGAYGGFGVVYKLDTTGTEKVLYRFNGVDGSGPVAGLIGDSKGNLYGTTFVGGTGFAGATGTGYGVVFKLTP